MDTPFLGLRTCIYRVDDLDRAVEWYSEVLGFGPYFNEPFYVGFNVGGFELGLLPDDAPAAGKTASVETYWGVDDAAAIYERLLAQGATALSKPADVGEGIIVATVKDPWGNVIGIIKNPHFKPE